ncbi:hypothetical protein WICPIJ_005891 [Wickerhamomyces pijperi]|uniref:Uncharacterized protein n=1 Tax=Wickerhamomyces pijperi TaxID=599730 RepID=A0A9P8TKQ0_WICPI|nr:hypothetical protein WICPIJ_005891 [Wickerhamomyces pijperi]
MRRRIVSGRPWIGGSMLGRSSLDGFQTVYISLLEVPRAVTEFPGRQVMGVVVVASLGAVVVANFVEAIHVQLADKRGDVGVLEVLWKSLAKLFAWSNEEGIVVLGPPDQMLEIVVLQHIVKLVDENCVKPLGV